MFYYVTLNSSEINWYETGPLQVLTDFNLILYINMQTHSCIHKMHAFQSSLLTQNLWSLCTVYYIIMLKNFATDRKQRLWTLALNKVFCHTLAFKWMFAFRLAYCNRQQSSIQIIYLPSECAFEPLAIFLKNALKVFYVYSLFLNIMPAL